MARVQVKSNRDVERLRPTASPVDSFAPEGPSPLSQLADALKGVSPEVAQLGSVLSERENKSDLAGGEQLARQLSEQGIQWQQAIKEGKVPAHASPFFKVGVEREFGKLLAGRYYSDFTAAFNKDPASQSTNLKDFDAYLTKHMGTWLKENVGENRTTSFESGFGDSVDNYVIGARAQFAQQIGDRLMKQGEDNLFGSQLTAVESGASSGMDDVAIAGNLQRNLDEMVAAGMNPTLANQVTARAIAEAADNAEDPGMVERLLRKVKTNGKATIWGTQMAQDVNDKVAENIAQKVQRRYSAAKERESYEREVNTRNLYRDFTTALDGTSNPQDFDVEPWKSRALAIGGDALEHLYAVRDGYAKRTWRDDEESVNDAVVRIHSKAPGEEGYFRLSDATALLAARKITPETFRQLRADLEERDDPEKGSGSSKLLRDPVFQAGVKELTNNFGADIPIDNPLMRRRFSNAHAELMTAYLQYVRANPEVLKDPLKIRRWMTEMVNEISKSKLDVTGANEISQVPGVRDKGKPIKSEEQAVVDPSVLSEIQSEVDSVVAGTRQGLSKRTEAALAAAGVPATAEGIQKFLADQTALQAK